MKLTFKRTAISLALAGSTLLTGCNFIGDGDPVFVDPIEPVTKSITIGGEATKGALVGADVYACIVKSACTGADVNTIEGSVGFVGKAETGAEGQYTLNITNENAFGKAVVVRIIANSNTQMDCDAYDDAGNEDCSDVTLDGTELKTITVAPTPAADGTAQIVDVDASVLSTLATELIESDEDLTDTIDASALATKAKNKSKAIATLLKITIDDDVDFTKLKVASAKPGNAKFAALNDKQKDLAKINASFAKLAPGQNLGTELKSAVSTVRAIVKGGQDAVTTTVTDSFRKVAAVVDSQVKKSSASTQTTVPVTVNPDDVTVEKLKQDAEVAKNIQENGNTGSSGGSGGGNSNTSGAQG